MPPKHTVIAFDHLNRLVHQLTRELGAYNSTAVAANRSTF
jgi:hypothetical protein